MLQLPRACVLPDAIKCNTMTKIVIQVKILSENGGDWLLNTIPKTKWQWVVYDN